MGNAPAKRFSEFLRTAREAMGLSQAELAEKLGVKQAALSLLERGDRLPSAATLIALADALHVSTDQLLGRHAAMLLPHAVEPLAPYLPRLSKEDSELLAVLAKELVRRHTRSR